MISHRDDSRTVNAWWFGTRGAYEVGDQAALQAALDFAALTGRALFIPRGIYRVSQSLLIGSNTRVYGDSAGGTILRSVGATITGSTVNGGTLYAVIGAIAKSNIEVYDITCDMLTGSTIANGIAFIPDLAFAGTGCSNIHVERCRVLGYVEHEYLYWSFNTTHIKFINNFADGNCVSFSPFADQNGIEIVGGVGAIVRGNHVVRCANFGVGAVSLDAYTSAVDGAILEGNYISDCGTGVSLGTSLNGAAPQNMRNVTVSGNVIRNSNRYGIDVWTPSVGTSMRNVLVARNVIDGGPVAIFVHGFAADTGHRNVLVADNVCTGQTTVSGADGAVAVTSFNGATFRGNSISECLGVAFRASFTNDTTFSDNTIHRSVGLGFGGTDGVRTTISNNRFIDCATGGVTYSILYTTSTDCVIARNVFSQAGAFSHITLTGNRGRISNNVSLACGNAILWQNLCTNPDSNIYSAAAVAPGVGVASIDIANTLATNAADQDGHIAVTQVAGAPNPVTVTRLATGFRLTFQVAAVGNEQYRWAIRQ